MAGSPAVLLNLYLLEIVCSVIASHLPDQLEKPGRDRIGSHRTWTDQVHVWLLPMLLILGSMPFWRVSPALGPTCAICLEETDDATGSELRPLYWSVLSHAIPYRPRWF